MGKRDEYIQQLIPMLADQGAISELGSYLIENSRLPGPRSNLELAYAFADCFTSIEIKGFHIEFLKHWAAISEKEARVNDPMEFLPCCAILAMGAFYPRAEEKFKKEIIHLLKEKANDGRWRVREAVAMGFQRIGEQDFTIIVNTFSTWINHATLTEQRAILAALAHPQLLKNPNNVRFCLHIAENVFTNVQGLDRGIRKTENFRILKKGLEYTISVFVAHLPEEGFSFLRKWLQVKDADIRRIIKSNLAKKRISKPYNQQVTELLSLIEKANGKNENFFTISATIGPGCAVP